MRQFVIDELSPMERDNIDSYLKRNLTPGPMIGLYWIVLPAHLYSDLQQNHKDHGPFQIAIELEQQSIRIELLVRSQGHLHCNCTAYATTPQRQFILDFIDTMLNKEQIHA
ncbi:MAG: hypothetical protein CSA26_02145 [Desulfobacterales bacterium]|nr:MAG: hypothetical protein CSA26_02145 [Desulfobacterales bacterium]